MHRLGLLRPAQVDPFTGYRRYTVDQFAPAGLIRRLRELEVPLSEIAEILGADTPERAHSVVERHRARITARFVTSAKPVPERAAWQIRGADPRRSTAPTPTPAS